MPNLRVYILAPEEAAEVHSAIEKIEHLPTSGTTEGMQEFVKAFDQLTASLKALGESRALTRTDKTGRFSMQQLKPGRKYLVIAIDWDKGDSDEVAYYRYFTTAGLAPGINELNIYMGPGQQRDCRPNRTK